MEREIKFRGKSKNTGDWLYGVPAKSVNDNMYLIHSATEDAINTFNDVDFVYSEVIPETVGQFTDLKDKNGVEIYEGDIVIEKSYPMYDNSLCNYRCVVVWDEEKVGFGLEMYVVSNRVRGCAVPDSISEYTELEVIGNIYDNPEML